MDVNGSRFHLVMGARDWLPLLADQPTDHLWWDEQRAAISLTPRLARFPARRGETPPSLARRRGAACDRFGNVHWIDEDRQTIRILPGGTQEAGVFWSVNDLEPPRPQAPAGEFRSCQTPAPSPLPYLRGLTINRHHYLIVGTLQPAGLLIFDLHAGGAPLWLLWPESVPFAPFDMSPTADGGLWILDRGPEAGAARVWRLDRWLRVVPSGTAIALALPQQDDFKPLHGTPRQTPTQWFPSGITLGLASPVEVAEPVAIVALADASVLILESAPAANASFIHRYRGGVRLTTIELAGASLAPLLDVPLKIHDFAFLPEQDAPRGTVRGELYTLAGDGNQAFAFTLEADGDRLHLNLRPRYLPLRRFSGKALIEAGDQVLYDLAQRWLPLVEQPRPRFEQQAVLDGLVFDSGQPDCVWHRLFQDACIAPGDALSVESRTANERGRLAESPWIPEPQAYLRKDGSELFLHTPFSARERGRTGTGTWELLFQNARGRFLELRLRLYGSGRSSPRLKALRVWYPRFSYLQQYLPAAYREQAVSAAVLDRFLANPEGMFTLLEERVAGAEALFDSRTSPLEYLDWLAGWFGVLLESDWDERRRRLFIAHAELLYRWRGTPAGLLAMIRLAIDSCPDPTLFDELRGGRDPSIARFGGAAVRIVEHFLSRRFAGVELGDPRRLEQPSLVTPDAPYEPAQGPAPLHQRYQAFLQALYNAQNPAAALAALNVVWKTTYTDFAEIRFPPLLPEDETMAADWQAFIERGLGFSYAAVSSDDTAAYRDFLRRRYERIELLNQAYALVGDQAYAGFNDLSLPSALPDNRRRLADWIGFVSLALPIRRNAHRFTVLIPTEPDDTEAERNLRLDRVRAIVEREKPAHAEFDVQPFWALFQVGGARLGLDTILGEGSRYTSLVLGSSFLGQSFLAESHPWNVRHRRLIGRDPLTESRPL